jgi:hypothetical protein
MSCNLCSTSDIISKSVRQSCRVLTFKAPPSRFPVPTRLSRFQLSSGSDIERYPTAAHQPQPNLISNSDWRRFKAVRVAARRELSDCSFKLCVSLHHLLLCTLSFPFLSPGRLRKTTIIANIRASKRISNHQPTFSTLKHTSRSSGHLWSVNVATTQNLLDSSDDFTPLGRVHRINCRQTRILLHFMHALHLGFLGKLHIEAFVVQARLISMTGLLSARLI